MSKKLTTEQFITKAISIHGKKYNYSKVNYKNAKERIEIICNIHGVFLQTPDKHIYGKNGCELCGREAAKQTNLERYGTEYTFQSENNKNKSKLTCLEKYGYESHNKSAIVNTKKKLRFLERYGVENPFQSEYIKDKIKKTNIKKYGVNNNTQLNMINILPLISDKDWLFEQYIVLGKTTYQIAQELNISDVTIGNYLKKHEIEVRYTVGYSMKCIKWLESIIQQEQIFIQHAMNGGEYQIPGTRFKVDGYCEETNTCYEFHGDLFHGNPDLFEDDARPHFYKNHLTAKELYYKTIERENKIKEMGYNLITMWENDFNQQSKFL
jgi:hypothetical protein